MSKQPADAAPGPHRERKRSTVEVASRSVIRISGMRDATIAIRKRG